MSSELPPSGEPHIPLHAEDLTVSKLTVAGDMVRVRTVTREHETFVDEALNHERGADRTKTDWPSGRSHSAARSAGRRYDNTSGGGRNPRHRAPPYSERRSSYPATNTGKNRGGEHCEARSAGRGIGAHMGRRFVHTAPPRRATARGCFPPPRTLARTVLSAFAPTGQTTRCRARLSGLQDAECDRRSAHVTKASRHRRHVLAHAGSDAQEISEFVVPPAIAPC